MESQKMTDVPRILIVDDEAGIRDSLLHFLEDYDFAVDAAASAEDALMLLETWQYQAAIVDIRLPQMDGDTFIVHAHEIDPGMQFIIHTGSVEYRLSKEIKNAGIHIKHVFLKPLIDIVAIIDALKMGDDVN